MTAARLDIQWKENALEGLAIEVGITRHLAQPRPHLRCPRCKSILYTRRHKLCGVCGEELPEELLFTQEEAERITRVLASEQQKHRTWMNRRVEARVR